ncbi:uncharacterized protein EV420DRAFT_415617 [Desarmillaria tabescens]|uniref:Heterokaryon incompatibility domain-containing protein n=1 Tax=Armillaria tabescens TaxID=1929756 RepID=A0AA39N5G0_ARMTA|nr:uncharacterized protein EV420DRAFT_415617 [Desarmillaria tabescens]KAK0458104.1 hypothetical protein EV420DRAFT_415617 [Desarmillaria tabescens]
MASEGKSIGKQTECKLMLHFQHIPLPKVTISAFTETGQPESSIIVPKQRAYTSRKPVISSRLADTPCATLGIWGLLDLLNMTLGTSHTLDTPSLSPLLEDCITNNYDFGMAYGRLRPIWYTRDWSTIRDLLRRQEEEDQEMRREAYSGNRIVHPHLQPRRVWDLYSNRVVPWWSTGIPVYERDHWPRPISHAWIDGKDRVDVWTPINGYGWPVPIPKDTNLKLIRIEMLNLEVEYTWLDVLCLRQVGGWGEYMRTEEWKLDVPTIGAVYDQRKVVCYLSGLGRPLTLKEGDLDSDRSWFRRAWTLQEVGGSRVIAGDMPDRPLHAKPVDEGGNYETGLLTRFHKQLKSIDGMSYLVFAALKGMQNRVSTTSVDKVAGLAFFLGSKMLPVYHEGQSLEQAWTALVNSMAEWHRGPLFFWYPEPGNSGKKWRPSWDQVMTKPLPVDHDPIVGMGIDRDDTTDEDWCDVECIVTGLVRGLAVVEGVDRYGELTVQDKEGIEHVFNFTATHKYPIPEDVYTLVRTFRFTLNWECPWVIGRRLPGKRFEKVSVLEIADEEGWRRLCDLHITKQHRYILV